MNNFEEYGKIIPDAVKRRDIVYSIAFDLDNDTLEKTYRNPSYNNAYTDIKNFLVDYGFTSQQGSVYFGNKDVDAISTVIAVQKLAKKYPWFAASIKDIRMLRIEDNNDLLPAIKAALE